MATWYAALARAQAVDVTAVLVLAAIVTALLNAGYAGASLDVLGLSLIADKRHLDRPARPPADPRTGMSGGALLFARYAYPPNALGYCGAGENRTLLEYGEAGVSDGGLVQLARSFEGAWPYLELIAGANGIDDPLDPV